jgi:dCMP deaminase
MVPSWDEYFLHIAFAVAKRSKDPSTQIGVVIVDSSNHIVSTGYNGFPPSASDDRSYWQDREKKYPRVIHAEANAIAHAAKVGISLEGATLYCTHKVCNKHGCARMIIAAGIKNVVYAKSLTSNSAEWEADVRFAEELFRECGVSYRRLTHVVEPIIMTYA